MANSDRMAEAAAAFAAQGVSAQANLGPDGRLLIPAAIRDAAGIKRGDKVTMQVENGRIVVESWWSQIMRVREILAHRVVPGESWSDELIADRRAESLRESED